MSGNTRKLLVPLATMAVAAAVTIGSGANWSASVPTTTMAGAGVLKVDNQHGATLTISNMKPGDVRTGSLTITNTGSVPADIALKETVNTLVAPAFAFQPGDLQIQIQRDGDLIYPAVPGGTAGPTGDFGAIGGWGSTSQDVTNSNFLLPDDPATLAWDAGQTVFTFLVKLAVDDENDQGASASIGYDFTFTPKDGSDSTETFVPKP